MENITNFDNIDPAIINDESSYNKEIKSVPKPEANIGIDTKDTLFSNIVGAGLENKVDISALEKFLQISQSRNEIYNLLDSMAQDSIISAILETYAEDATEYNEQGKIVWAESSNPKALQMVNYLLESLQVDKYAYGWVHSLCKYGDLYLRLFRTSEYDDDLLFNTNDKKPLNEAVKIKKYSKNDKFVHYVEAVKNPAEMFELTRFGKTMGYIKADASAAIPNTNVSTFNTSFVYSYKKNDVTVFASDNFVHAFLDDNSSRTSEEVNIFLNNNVDEEPVKYKVRRGQSLLYNSFKIWRELSLLENSMLLNRVSKSSILRAINVEVGDMPKEMVGPHLQGIKSLIEQKTALNVGQSMNEYTSPGPIENNIYIPTHNGIGAITTTEIGGEVNISQLPDIEYFQNKYFGSLRVPKQYFGLTNDAAGFSGGQSLAIISSRYAKAVKKIQNAFLQALTSVINIMLLDKGLKIYVNDFTLKMQPPTTQEEIDRRDNLSAKVAITRDIKSLIDENVTNDEIKLKVLKSLLSGVVTDQDIINLIQEQINDLEKGEEQTLEEDNESETFTQEPEFNDLSSEIGIETEETPEAISTSEEESTSETTLPTPEELGVGDFTDNTSEI